MDNQTKLEESKMISVQAIPGACTFAETDEKFFEPTLAALDRFGARTTEFLYLVRGYVRRNGPIGNEAVILEGGKTVCKLIDSGSVIIAEVCEGTSESYKPTI